MRPWYLLFVLAGCASPAPPVPADTQPADSETPTLSDTDEPPDETDDPVDDTPVDPTDTARPQAGSSCSLGAHARNFDLNLTHAGRARTAIVDLPPGYDGTEALPVVLNFHGNAMSASSQRLYSRMHTKANNRGWIAVHPDGLLATWNVLPGSTDVTLAGAIIDELSAEVCVDPSRIYVTGMSQGGNLSYMIACGLSARIAAIAPVAGSNVAVICAARTPVPVFHIHGNDDGIVSYDGGLLYPSAPDSVNDWAREVNHCNASPVPGLTVGAVSCNTRECAPRTEATLCTVDGGGHTWPGAAPIPLLRDTNYDIDASDEILAFFARHSL